MDALGVGMHPLQDLPAHQHLGATPLEMWLMHIPPIFSPDDDCEHQEAFSEAFGRTEWYLNTFLKEVQKRRAARK